ncbi:MAG: metallophosphoesterase [Polyangiales bacterium]
MPPLLSAIALAALCALPVALLARRRPLRARWLALPPALYLLSLALYVTALHLRQHTRWARPTSGDLGEFAAASFTLYGFGVIFPALALTVVAPWLARRGRPRASLALTAASLAAALTTAWALFVEPATLVEREYHLRSPRAPAGGLVILHLSDLQTDGPCRRERLALAAIARRPTPDLVLFTGDLANGPDDAPPPGERARAVREFLSALRARHGVYGVLGDWDRGGRRWERRVASLVRGTSMRMLSGASVTVEVRGAPVTVYGIDELSAGPVRAMRALPGYRIFMAHHPDRVVERLPPDGADLALAGHTHGGQVSLPLIGAPVVHNGHGFTGGLYQQEGIPFVISRGIGMRGGAAPRVRFNVPPEIGWITVTR